MSYCSSEERKDCSKWRTALNMSSSGHQIPVLGEDDYYKFLGKYENATQ